MEQHLPGLHVGPFLEGVLEDHPRHPRAHLGDTHRLDAARPFALQRQRLGCTVTTSTVVGVWLCAAVPVGSCPQPVVNATSATAAAAATGRHYQVVCSFMPAIPLTLERSAWYIKIPNESI